LIFFLQIGFFRHTNVGFVRERSRIYDDFLQFASTADEGGADIDLVPVVPRKSMAADME